MRMNALREHEPEPGLLVEWHPAARTAEAVARRGEHPAPPSSFQDNHIRRSIANDAAGVVHSPWLSTSFDLPGELDPQALAAAWRRWVQRHGTLLTWFEQVDGQLVRYAISGEDVEFTPVEVGRRSGAEIREHLQERFASGASALRWPGFVLAAVLRPEKSTVYFAVDHAHTDGYSIFLVFDELRRLYAEETTGEPADLPEVGDHADFAARERAAEVPAEQQAAAVEIWRDFWLSGGEKPPSFPLPLGVEDGGFRTKLQMETELFDAKQATRFQRRCREHGGGIAAGVFAALAVAATELSGVDSYRTLTPMQTRDEPRWAAAQGWFINLVPVHFDLTGRETFGEVLTAAEQAFERARRIADVPVVKLMQLLGSKLQLQQDERTVLPIMSFIDLRRIRGSEDWEAANAQVLSGPGEGFDVPMWINRLRGLTYLRASYPDTPVAAENVARYLERVREVLHRIVDDGDHAIRRAPSTAAQPG